MPSFKPKNMKNIVIPKKNIATLDAKHKEITEIFKKELYETLPELKKERKELKNKIKKKDDLSTDEFLDIQDRLKVLKKEISEINNNKKEYLLNNSQYIFDYFENKKKIADSINVKKPNILDDFFKIKKDKEDDEPVVKKLERTSVQKYLANIDETCIDISSFVVQTDSN